MIDNQIDRQTDRSIVIQIERDRQLQYIDGFRDLRENTSTTIICLNLYLFKALDQKRNQSVFGANGLLFGKWVKAKRDFIFLFLVKMIVAVVICGFT